MTDAGSTPADGRAGGTRRDADGSGRGQLVLVAAVALAVALVPLVLAYLQLGYHDDIRAGSGTAPAGQTETALDRALHDAATDVPSEHSWQERSAAVDAADRSCQLCSEGTSVAASWSARSSAVSVCPAGAVPLPARMSSW